MQRMNTTGNFVVLDWCQRYQYELVFNYRDTEM